MMPKANGNNMEVICAPAPVAAAVPLQVRSSDLSHSPHPFKRPSPQPQQDRNNVRTSLVAGSCSGILSTVAIYPMDVLRTKMQNDNAGSTLQVFKHTIQHGGVRALYTGLALPLAAQAVYKATVFSVNDMTQNFIMDYRTSKSQKKMDHTFLPQHYQQLTLGDRFWCGFVGGAVNAAAFVTPVEFVRNQLIAQHSKLAATGDGVGTYFRGSWDVIRQAFRKQGVLSLWRGTSWSVGRDGIGCGCFFYAIAWAQQKLTPPGEKPSFSTTVLSGCLAGLAFWVTALPLDTIKTWIQSSDLALETVSAKDVIRKIYSEQGAVGVVQRLNRGWQVAYGRGIPSSAITITTYSLLYDYLQQGETI